MNISEKLKELLKSPRETEILEFKEAKNKFDIETLGKYFSALSNEANLKGSTEAWLLFGINNEGKVVGSDFRKEEKHLHNLKEEIGSRTTHGITFADILK